MTPRSTFRLWARRISYVISPEGKILYAYSDSNAEKHIENTLAVVRKWHEESVRVSPFAWTFCCHLERTDEGVQFMTFSLDRFPILSLLAWCENGHGRCKSLLDRGEQESSIYLLTSH